jgi:ribonuclease P protein component
VNESLACGSAKEGGSSKAPPLLFSPYRLPKQAFDALFTASKARALSHKAFVLRWLPTAEDRPRVGVIATKRTFHHAVDRHRAKRLLREAFRLEQPTFKRGVDLVLLARTALLTLSMDEIRQALRTLAARARLLRKDPHL